MKRILRLAAVVLGLAALLCGCGIINSSDEETDALYRAIIASIEADDADALRSLFSEEALEKCTDFEAGFAYTVEAYKGTLVEMKPVSYTEDAHYDKGRHTKEARALYSVETTEQSYFLYVCFFPSDTIEPAREGVYRVILLNDRAEKSYDSYAGVYNPGWDEAV